MFSSASPTRELRLDMGWRRTAQTVGLTVMTGMAVMTGMTMRRDAPGCAGMTGMTGMTGIAGWRGGGGGPIGIFSTFKTGGGDFISSGMIILAKCILNLTQ